MKTPLISIGNSKGVRIPKAILEQCHFTKEADLQVKGNIIFLKPVKKKIRQGWDQAFATMHKNKEDRLFIVDTLDLKIKDWEW